jgi:hypothetical protein
MGDLMFGCLTKCTFLEKPRDNDIPCRAPKRFDHLQNGGRAIRCGTIVRPPNLVRRVGALPRPGLMCWCGRRNGTDTNLKR